VRKIFSLLTSLTKWTKRASPGQCGELSSEQTITEIVIFDGDQATKTDFLRFYKENPSTEYVWVQNSNALPKFLRNRVVGGIVAPSFGKESVDKLIAMMLVDFCHRYQNLQSVFIISADGDFVDILETLGIMFPMKRFTQLVNTSRPLRKNLRETCARLRGTNRAVYFYSEKQNVCC
jgi:hypothetical protein